LHLTNRVAVKAEYSDESRHNARRAAFARWLDGPNAADVALEAVLALGPERVLEIGGGDGVFAERLQARLEHPVIVIDISPRMVELARARGLTAGIGDAVALPFPNASFDCVIANWMLYHVAELHNALSEIVRLLRPGGALVAATLGVENLSELWQLIGAPPNMSDYIFTRESGGAILASHFGNITRHDVDARVCFPGPREVREYVAASLGWAHLVKHVPDDLGSFQARTSQAIFVAV
jgi:SAM-dependent methyltransferase